MSVSVYGVKLWNSRNDDCKTCNNEYFLKKKYKDKVFKEYQNIELQQETSTVQLYNLMFEIIKVLDVCRMLTVYILVYFN